MASKRRSFISLIFIINCITKCSLIRIIIIILLFFFTAPIKFQALVPTHTKLK